MTLLGIPSASSKFHDAVVEVLERGLGDGLAPDPPSLFGRSRRCDVVGARGRDLPRLVGLGLVDAALTGLDAYLEAILDGFELSAWSIASTRPSRLCLMTAQARRADPVERVLSEYPRVTSAWLSAEGWADQAEVIPMRGSIEGLVRGGEGLWGVATVVSGKTMRANGLVACRELLRSDVCLVAGRDDSDWASRLGSVISGPAALPDWAPPQPQRARDERQEARQPKA